MKKIDKNEVIAFILSAIIMFTLGWTMTNPNLWK